MAAPATPFQDMQGELRKLAPEAFDEAAAPRILVDPEEVIAGAAAASALCMHILSEANALQNDGDTREGIAAGAEAMILVLQQLETPTSRERRLLSELARWADDHAALRRAESAEIAATTSRSR